MWLLLCLHCAGTVLSDPFLGVYCNIVAYHISFSRHLHSHRFWGKSALQVECRLCVTVLDLLTWHARATIGATSKLLRNCKFLWLLYMQCCCYTSFALHSITVIETAQNRKTNREYVASIHWTYHCAEGYVLYEL